MHFHLHQEETVIIEKYECLAKLRKNCKCQQPSICSNVAKCTVLLYVNILVFTSK